MSADDVEEDDVLFEGRHLLPGLPDGRSLHALVHAAHEPTVYAAPRDVSADLAAQGFDVVFADGRREHFACVLDAHDRMNERDSGAVQTVCVSNGKPTATPVPFDYSGAWRMRTEPEWRSQ